MEKERGIKITYVDKSTDKNGVLHIVIGRVYGQTITGTTFKHRVLKVVGISHTVKWLQVENIETGHRQIISETELHAL